MLELLLLVGIIVYIWYNAFQLKREIKENDDDEHVREADFVVSTGIVDKEKPWPVILIRFINGIQVGSTNLKALDISYGQKVIGSYDGWKIYDTVSYEGSEYIYDNVAIKQAGRYQVRGQGSDMFLILAPGLSYKRVN